MIKENPGIAVITTFPNYAWDIYARQMIESFVKFWPAEIPLMIQLDDDCLVGDIKKIVRPQDLVAFGWQDDHKAFVERNKGKDDPKDYRKQAVRFCHKVFVIKQALDFIGKYKTFVPPEGHAKEEPPRYLIWMDADVITTAKPENIKDCLPKEGDVVAYMGRKDWDHSECGWLAFDLENRGGELIETMFTQYKDDIIFNEPQWHDSWIWDKCIKTRKSTNLTIDKPGMDIWPQSPMGKWSTHHKGPVAKDKMAKPNQKQMKEVPLQIRTQNAIPNPEILNNIRTNQILIKNWIQPCKKTDEEIVIVSAGPQLIVEDIPRDKRIVAVKHALEPLQRAGITPWACILLDPRDHVASFVNDADKEIIWIVASQVNPEVTMKLLEKGCRVWGYHAAVGAGEDVLTKKQELSIVQGGSATATRGLYALYLLGFSNFDLYGYDLCYAEKPDLALKDDRGQPKFLEVSVGMHHPLYNMKKGFWTEGQLVAQYEEIKEMLLNKKINLKANGQGMIPFLINGTKLVKLRENELEAKLDAKRSQTYGQLLCLMEAAKAECSQAMQIQVSALDYGRTKKTPSSGKWGKRSLTSRRRQTKRTNS